MKKLIPAVIILILSTVSCKKVDELTKFNLTFNNKVTIPSSSVVNLPFNIITPDIETNSSAQFESNDTRKDLIEEINITAFEMQVEVPAGEDFSFLESIDVFISAEGLSETRMAWNNDVPENVGATLNLETTDADLKEYIKKDKFALRVNAVTDEALTRDHELNIRTVYLVDAKILGQ